MRLNSTAALAFVMLAASGPVLAQGASTSAPPAASAPSTATQQYIGKAAIGDRFEVESSRLALSKSKDERIHRFAQMMVDDHSRMSTRLQQAVQEAGLAVEPPAELDDAHEEMIDDLEAADGAEFDRLYVEMQTKAHQEARHLHSNYAANGDLPRLKALAGEAVPVIERHLEQVQQLGAR